MRRSLWGLRLSCRKSLKRSAPMFKPSHRRTPSGCVHSAENLRENLWCGRCLIDSPNSTKTLRNDGPEADGGQLQTEAASCASCNPRSGIERGGFFLHLEVVLRRIHRSSGNAPKVTLRPTACFALSVKVAT